MVSYPRLVRKRDLVNRVATLEERLAGVHAGIAADRETYKRREGILRGRADTLAKVNERLVDTIAKLKVPVVQAAPSTPIPDIPAILHEAMAGFTVPSLPPQPSSPASNPDDIYRAQEAAAGLPWMPHSDWAPEALSDPFIGLDGRPVGIEVMGVIGKDTEHIAVTTPMGDEVARADGQPMFRSASQ